MKTFHFTHQQLKNPDWHSCAACLFAIGYFVPGGSEDKELSRELKRDAPSVTFSLNHCSSYRVLASRSLPGEWCHRWQRGEAGQSQPRTRPHLPQSDNVAIISILLLSSSVKGLIMLMKHPSGLVLGVRDTAVGLGGKPCAKCVT